MGDLYILPVAKVDFRNFASGSVKLLSCATVKWRYKNMDRTATAVPSSTDKVKVAQHCQHFRHENKIEAQFLSEFSTTTKTIFSSRENECTL